MSSRVRTTLANAPVKLISVLLFAVLIPSLLVTALGLVEVFQADRFVRQSLRRPIERQLYELREHVAKVWTERLNAYRLSAHSAGERRPYLAQLQREDPAVREVLLWDGHNGVERIHRWQPRILLTIAPHPELETLQRLEFVEQDFAAVRDEALKLLAATTSEVVALEAMMSAARSSDKLGDLEGATEYLSWAVERFGPTQDHMQNVREVAMGLRLAELAAEKADEDELVQRLRALAVSLEKYAPFMPAEEVERVSDRMKQLTPSSVEVHSAAAESQIEHGESVLTDPELESLAGRFRAAAVAAGNEPPTFSWHRGLGDTLVFVGLSLAAEGGGSAYVVLSLQVFLDDARPYCDAFNIPFERLELVPVDTKPVGEDDAVVLAAPAPLSSLKFRYTPTDELRPQGFRAFNVVPLATFTWAVVVIVATIVVGAVFTLRYILRELETARLKTDFVSFVSHELKTPLTAIRMYTETMLDGRVRDETDRSECVQMIDQESQRLSKLIDQILEYSKLERHRKKFRFASADMLEIVRESIRIFHKHHREPTRIVELHSAQHISKIRVDRAAMIELLLNLINNAAKYSDPAKRITVNLRESITDISVEVVDEGVGIRKRDHKKIFDRFYRADDYLTRDVDGTGLGLTFARYIAKVHNGDIKVASQLGSGSSFTLSLRKTHVLAE